MRNTSQRKRGENLLKKSARVFVKTWEKGDWILEGWEEGKENLIGGIDRGGHETRNECRGSEKALDQQS